MARLFSVTSTTLLTTILLLIVWPIKSEDPDKWVWDSDGDGDSGGRRGRYDVVETEDSNFVGSQGASYGVDGTGFINRPSRPGQSFYKPERPFGVYGSGHGRPTYAGPHGHGGGFGHYGRPTSINREPFKYVDKCVCIERFNCRPGGLAYGQCDVGKQYCCYGKTNGPPPNRPIHSAGNGVLIGPDGPYDRPVNNRPSGGNGVLVGPGGPTGIIGRPTDNGVLVGPGGPTGIIGRPTDNGVLVGPGGPTGIIGRPTDNGVLVGPGGPTGIVGRPDYPYRPGLYLDPRRDYRAAPA